MRPWPTLSALVRHRLPFMRRCVAGKGRAGRCEYTTYGEIRPATKNTCAMPRMTPPRRTQGFASAATQAALGASHYYKYNSCWRTSHQRQEPVLCRKMSLHQQTKPSGFWPARASR